MQKAGIAGATGYIGYELITLIHRHPELEVGWLTSERNAGKRFNQVFSTPWAYPLISLADAYLRTDEVDVVFLCLPHAKSMEAVKRFYAAGVRIIDLSADFRLKDVDVYKRWYGVEHTAPELWRRGPLRPLRVVPQPIGRRTVDRQSGLLSHQRQSGPVPAGQGGLAGGTGDHRQQERRIRSRPQDESDLPVR